MTDFRTALGDLDPAAIAADIDLHGTDWAQLKEAADLLEDSTKPVLAQLTNLQRAKNPHFSRKEAEDLAIGSQEFMDHLYAKNAARLQANVARVKYEAARARFEALRSLEATRRIEMQHLSRRP